MSATPDIPDLTTIGPGQRIFATDLVTLYKTAYHEVELYELEIGTPVLRRIELSEIKKALDRVPDNAAFIAGFEDDSSIYLTFCKD